MMKPALSLTLILACALIASAQTPVQRLEGQVVCCEECWAEADRTKVEYGTAEDLLAARSCVEGGDPTLLAVREGEGFRLYRLEQGKFRLPGRNWLEFVGKRIAVKGTIRESKEARVVRVDALEVMAPSKAERDAANISGQVVELALKDLFGAQASLTQYRGRIVILNFWATYCEPCRREMPDLAAIQNGYAALGVQVIGASADEAVDRPKVLQFIKETKINFPVWIGATSADMTRFGLGGALPGTVIIDREGRVAKVISGVVNQADLKKELDRMLASFEAANRARAAVAVERQVKGSSVPS